MTQALLQQAIEAIKRGDKRGGQRLLAQVLRADPHSETAWLWMSQIVETDAQRLDCLNRILAINPENATALRAAELLKARMVAGPPSGGPTPPTAKPPATTETPRRVPTGPLPAAPPPVFPPIPPESPASMPYPSPFSDASTGQAAPAELAATYDARGIAAGTAPSREADRPPPAPPATRKPAAPRPRSEQPPARRLPVARIALLLALAIAGAAAVFAIVRSQASQPPATPAPVTARIAAVREQEGRSDLVLLQSDGTGLTELGQLVSVGARPSWAPDGTRIAFATQQDGSPKAAIIQANGSGFAPLADGLDPAFSPDGLRIAFAADREGDYDIYVTSPDGAEAINLTRFEGDDRSPAWTPDGRAIVFQSDREGQFDIYRMSATGFDVTRLTDSPAADTDPAVSGDGERIAFVSMRGGDADIYVMNADGSDPRAVTDNAVDDVAPSWTPDGLILFTSMHEGGPALFTVRPDGTDLKPLWGASSADSLAAGLVSAAWQPTDADPAALPTVTIPTPTVAAPPFELPAGAFLFASNRTGDFGIYRGHFDGSAAEPVGDAGGQRGPAVSPVADDIALQAPVSDTQTIFVVDLAEPETAAIPLTQAGVSSYAPAWSSDGALVLYEFDAEGGRDLAVVLPDGTSTTRLTNRPGQDGCAAWQPGERHIAFTSDRDGALDLYEMDIDTLAVKRLTRHPAADRCPAYSPDGARLAFLSDRGGDGVYVMNADGSNARLLVALREALQPIWSPDGKFVLVPSRQDGDYDIYLISVEDQALWNLTDDSDADEVDPQWLP